MPFASMQKSLEIKQRNCGTNYWRRTPFPLPPSPCPLTMVAKLVSHRCPSCEAHIEAMEEWFLTFSWRSCYNMYGDSIHFDFHMVGFCTKKECKRVVESIKYQDHWIDHCGFSVALGTCGVIVVNVLIRGARNVGCAQEATAQGIHGDQRSKGLDVLKESHGSE